MNCDMFCYLKIWCASWKENDNVARRCMMEFDDNNVMLLRKMDAMEAELKKLKQE
jgi:hypothetical protein